MLNLRVDDAMLDDIDGAAAVAGQTRSEWLREALARVLHDDPTPEQTHPPQALHRLRLQHRDRTERAPRPLVEVLDDGDDPDRIPIGRAPTSPRRRGLVPKQAFGVEPR